ncbi:unnamed protein product [Musa banksii]
MDSGGERFPGGGAAGGFHRGEAIAAVQDEEQFYGDEDDFDDLYSDVNVGEGFLQSSRRSDEPAPDAVLAETPLPPPPPLPPSAPLPEKVHLPGITGEIKMERSAGVSVQEFRGGAGETAAVVPLPIPGGVRADLGQTSGRTGEIQAQTGGGGYSNEGLHGQGGGFGGEMRQGGANTNGGGVGEGDFGGSTLFVGELHWWTTDADLLAELSKYGQVKEIKFFDEKASGKSKGYCQVDFYDPMAAASCKEGMNGHMFNGRPCVVAFATPATVRRMGEAQLKNQNLAAQQSGGPPQKGRGSQQMGGNYGRSGGGGGGSGSGGSGSGGWGRGGMGNRGQLRNRMGQMGAGGSRSIMGNGGMVGPPPPVMHPGAMMGQGFDPTGYGAAMGRMGGAYGGFPAGPGVAAAAPFPGLMPSFPPVVAPHMNPAFFGRGGMLAGGVGMWPDLSMGARVGEEQSSYRDDGASEQQYGEVSHGKDKASDRDLPGASDRRHEWEEEMGHGQERPERHYDDRDLVRERDRDRDRDREREREREREKDRDRVRDWERERERERERGREWERDRGRERERERDREREREKDRISYIKAWFALPIRTSVPTSCRYDVESPHSYTSAEHVLLINVMRHHDNEFHLLKPDSEATCEVTDDLKATLCKIEPEDIVDSN